MVKRFFLASMLLILGGAIPCLGSGAIGTNQFSGLDSQDNPSALQPNQSQDLLNVRLQPGGRAVYKRDGYGLFQSLNSISTATVHGGYHFQQSGGADVQLWGSDNGLFASVNDATFVRVATGTVGATWQCTDNLGFAYCLTSANDTPVKTDGSAANTTYQPSIPAGTMIASTPLQLIVGGVSGNASSIYVSANNNFTNFTTGPLPTDPYVEIINSPGSRLTHLGYYFGNVYWWKDQSMGYMSGSASQTGIGITIVSNQIGTLDNSSAFWNPTTYDQGNKFNSGTQTTTSGNPYFNEMSSLGGIFFRGQDNHVYQYDGYTLTRLSRIITPNVVGASRRKANSWTQTTTSDFNLGSSTNVNTAGDQLSLGFLSESFNNLSNWTQYSGPWSATGNAAVPTYNGGISSTLVFSSPISIPSTKWKIGVSESIMLSGNTGGGPTVGMVNVSTQGYVYIGGCNPSNGKNVADIWKVSGSNYTFMYSGSDFGVCDTNFHLMELSQNGTTLTIYFDGNQVGQTTDSTYSGLNRPFLQCDKNLPNLSCNGFKNLNVGNSTGTFYSQVDNAPNITTWGTLAINDSVIGTSTITYYSRSSTNSFTLNSSTPTWIVQSKNSIVSASTGTYFQFRADFNATSSTQALSVNDFTFNWNEGSASDKAYIQYFQDAIWFSVSSSTSASTNNTIFYLDLLNNTWLKDDIAANGFAVENNSLYIGSPLASKVYKFGGVTTDNSLPIHSYWKSMDFTGQDPTVQNSWEQADFSFAQSSNTVTFTYDVDQSTSTFLKTVQIPLYSAKSSIIKRGFALSPGTIGTYYNFKVEDNSSLPAWTLMGQRTLYDPLPWRPQLSN